MKKNAPKPHKQRGFCAQESTPPPPESNLAALLSDQRTDRYLGRSAIVKFSVLAALLSGDEQHPGAKVAKQFGLTRAAVSRYVRRARAIFGFPKPLTKCKRS